MIVNATQATKINGDNGVGEVNTSDIENGTPAIRQIMPVNAINCRNRLNPIYRRQTKQAKTVYVK